MRRLLLACWLCALSLPLVLSFVGCATTMTHLAIMERQAAPDCQPTTTSLVSYAVVGGEAVQPEARPGSETYAARVDNAFMEAARAPLSTLSVEVDTASYSNV